MPFILRHGGPINQEAARQRLEDGNTPKELIDWLVLNDDGSDGHTIKDRQYGLVSIVNGIVMSEAYTGSNTLKEAAHINGKNYSIQGNILLDEKVIIDMENAFLDSKGTLADKLIAAMQGAKRPGADSRCLSAKVSSLSAFLRVAQPHDTDSTYGNLSLDINIGAVPKGVDPIDELQNAYNDWLNKSNK